MPASRMVVAVIVAISVVTTFGACSKQNDPATATGGGTTAPKTAPTSGSSAPASTSTPSTAKPGAASTAAVPGVAAVAVVDYLFSPEALQAKVGDRVVWTNQDDADHWIVTRDKSIDSGSFAKGVSVEQTVSKAGTIEYYCDIHNGMKGSIVVT